MKVSKWNNWKKINNHTHVTNERMYVCIWTYWYNTLHVHLQNKLLIDSIVYVQRCPHCEMVFMDRRVRTKHINIYHKNFIYRCKECDYETREASYIKAHYKVSLIFFELKCLWNIILLCTCSLFKQREWLHLIWIIQNNRILFSFLY